MAAITLKFVNTLKALQVRYQHKPSLNPSKHG